MKEILLWLILIINIISLCLMCKSSPKERFGFYGRGYFNYVCYQNGDCPKGMECVQDPWVKNTHGLCSPCSQ